MSADNWTFCPKCKQNLESDLEIQKKTISSLYGKVSPEEFLEKCAEIKKTKKKREPNLREDYEIYLDGSNLNIIYSCHCQDCEFQFKFKHTVNVLGG